ncbi:MAG: ATP-binding protein [Thermoleophilaceae bacterium]
MPDQTHLSIELTRDADSVRAARAALANVAHAIPAGRYSDAQLLLSELVTNAVKYGGDGSMRITISSVGDATHFEVVDQGGGFAARETAEHRDRQDLERVGGWGLPLVETLADEWGSFEGSTHVWFRLGPARRRANPAA